MTTKANAACAAAFAVMAACGPKTPVITYPMMPSVLTPVGADLNRTRDFARVFCATLPHLKDKDGRAWDECGKYIETPEPPQPAQTQLVNPYRFLFVSGFGGDCFQDVRAFSTAIEHLKDAHRIDVEYYAVAPYGSGEENGKLIAEHIEETWAADKARRLVLIGYDKGVPDLQEALSTLEDPRMKVAAIVSVAGIVGGMWLPEELRTLYDPARPWLAPTCPANMKDAMHTVARDVRQAFLRENPLPVPGYSIVATSTLDETSSVLRGTWKRLSIYAREQDGLMLAWESMLPGTKYLGAVRADHWAVALPFERLPKPPKGVDRTNFPRDAVFEAIVRYVIADLGAADAPKPALELPR